ncbi:MAG: response regulator [Phycisphaerales bacterium]|nr:MAG: response regulator [Phycisphaerales bacterium]
MGKSSPDAQSDARPDGDKQVFTTGEAARICNVSQQTIIRCFDSGRLQGFRVPGSRFRRIPRAELIRFMRTNEIPLDRIDAGRKRVLIVDDDPNIVELLTEVLQRDGRFEVRSAGSGYDAGMLTAEFRPHLIILDFMLPDINGDVVCRRVRESSATASTRIICVSGVVNQDEVDRLLKAGADEFVKKPFNIERLVERVGALVSGPEAGASGKDN